MKRRLSSVGRLGAGVLLGAAFTALLLPAFSGGTAEAHDIMIGVGSQAVFNAISRREIVVDFNMQYSSIAAFQELKKFDKNRDGDLSMKERTALTTWIGEKVQKETGLFFDGKKLEAKSLELSEDRSILMGRLDVLPFETWHRLTFVLPELEPGKMHDLEWLDNTYDGEVAQQDFWVPIDKLDM